MNITHLYIAATAAFAVVPASAVANPKDIVTTAVEAGSFTTLAAALEAAGLVGVLQGEGPFTLFAPTDAAFAKLPAGTVEALLADKEAAQVVTLDVLASNGVIHIIDAVMLPPEM